MKSLLFILADLVLWTSIAFSLLVIIFYSRLSQTNKYFGISMVFSTIIELFSMAWANEGKNNLIFFHIHTILEFAVLTLFFSRVFDDKHKLWSRWILLSGLFFILFNSIFIQTYETMNSFSLTIVSIYLIKCCLYYFYQIIDQDNSQDQIRFSNYAVFSIFILHSVSLMVLLFGNYMLTSKSVVQDAVWILRALIILLVKFVILFQLIKLIFTFYKQPLL